MWNLHCGKVILKTMLFKSQIMSNCFIYFLSSKKWEQEEISISIEFFIVYIFQALTIVPAMIFAIQWKIQRRFPCFKISLTVRLNLHCNDILKGKYLENTLTEFCECLLSNKCVQLKSHVNEAITVLGSTYVYKQTFQR